MTTTATNGKATLKCAFCEENFPVASLEQTHSKEWACRDEEACEGRQTAKRPAKKEKKPLPTGTPVTIPIPEPISQAPVICSTCTRPIIGPPDYIAGHAYCPLITATLKGKQSHTADPLCVKPQKHLRRQPRKSPSRTSAVSSS